jgi:hypothetical protein
MDNIPPQSNNTYHNAALDPRLGCMNEVSPNAMPPPIPNQSILPPPPQSKPPIKDSPTFTRQQSHISPQAGFAGPGSLASNEHAETGEAHTGDVDTGFLQVYGLEHQQEVESHVLSKTSAKSATDPLHPDLQQSFIETYFEYCYPYCPVLDRETLSDELARSPLLTQALAVVGSHVQPPLIPHEGPANYYKKARTLFYEDEEPDNLTTLKAVALFYWWAPMSTTVVQRHSSWWWTSVVIRHAQQMNFHREPGVEDPRRGMVDLSLRRRIWWTAFVSIIVDCLLD